MRDLSNLCAAIHSTFVFEDDMLQWILAKNYWILYSNIEYQSRIGLPPSKKRKKRIPQLLQKYGLIKRMHAI